MSRFLLWRTPFSLKERLKSFRVKAKETPLEFGRTQFGPLITRRKGKNQKYEANENTILTVKKYRSSRWGVRGIDAVLPLTFPPEVSPP